MGRFKVVTLKLVKDIRGRVFQEIYGGKKLLFKSICEENKLIDSQLLDRIQSQAWEEMYVCQNDFNNKIQIVGQKDLDDILGKDYPTEYHGSYSKTLYSVPEYMRENGYIFSVTNLDEQDTLLRQNRVTEKPAVDILADVEKELKELINEISSEIKLVEDGLLINGNIILAKNLKNHKNSEYVKGLEGMYFYRYNKKVGIILSEEDLNNIRYGNPSNFTEYPHQLSRTVFKEIPEKALVIVDDLNEYINMAINGLNSLNW